MGTKNITANTGGPTEILPMPSSSYTSGDKVPQSTSAANAHQNHIVHQQKELSGKELETPATYNFGARHAYRVSDPPIVNTRNARM